MQNDPQMEAIGMAIGAVVCLLFAFIGIKKPEWALKSRKSQFWVRLIGEQKTLLIIKYVSVPLLFVLAAFCSYMSLRTFGVLP